MVGNAINADSTASNKMFRPAVAWVLMFVLPVGPLVHIHPAAAKVSETGQQHKAHADPPAPQMMVVSTTGPVAIRAGVEVMRNGGSAADAVLTTSLAQIALCAGCWVSYAGRMTAVYYDAETKQVYAMNACYDAPRQERDPLSIPPQGTPSGRTVLVPGYMAGVGQLHERFGKVPFADLFQSAIHIADEGIELTPNMARLIRGKQRVLTRLPATQKVFTNPDGKLYQAGQRFKQPELATTLKKTAEQGAGYFYTGEWAKHFVDAVQAEGGRLTVEDLRQYRVHWEEPLTSTYRDYTICTLPFPNRGGPISITAMNLLEQSPLREAGLPTESAESLHRVAQVQRALGLLFSSRGRRAIEAMHPQLAISNDTVTDKATAQQLWKTMNSPRWKELLAHAAGRPLKTPEHSDAVVAVDRQGNVAAILHTINTGGWGTTGLFVDGVSIPDSAAHQQYAVQAAGPGGRISDHGPPTLVLKDGKPVLACSATGSGNVTTTWQNLLYALEFQMTPQQAVDQPSIYSGQIRRDSFDSQLVQQVADKGLSLRTVPRFSGSTLGFWVGIAIDPDTGAIRGGKIRRLDGIVVGSQ